MKTLNDASSMTAFTWPSKSTGSTTTLRGTARKRPEAIGTAFDGTSEMSTRAFSAAHWPSSPSPICTKAGWPVAPSSANAARRFSVGAGSDTI